MTLCGLGLLLALTTTSGVEWSAALQSALSTLSAQDADAATQAAYTAADDVSASNAALVNLGGGQFLRGHVDSDTGARRFMVSVGWKCVQRSAGYDRSLPPSSRQGRLHLRG